MTDEPKRGNFGEPWEYKEHQGYGEILNCRGQLVMETSQSKELMRHVAACVNALHASCLIPAQLAEVGPLIEAVRDVHRRLMAGRDERYALGNVCIFYVERQLRDALDRFDAAGEGE